jgi:hypothetical protein
MAGTRSVRRGVVEARGEREEFFFLLVVVLACVLDAWLGRRRLSWEMQLCLCLSARCVR